MQKETSKLTHISVPLEPKVKHAVEKVKYGIEKKHNVFISQAKQHRK